MAGEKRSARAEIDITPTYPSAYDPHPPWPYTTPEPRPIPYGKPGKRLNVLVLPGKVEYDPAMTIVEEYVRKMTAKGRYVNVIVPDVWRGIGEVLARRNGLNYMVINTDKAGATTLPSVNGFEKFARSKTARRRCLREADVVLIVDNNVAFKEIHKDIADHFEDLKVVTVGHSYESLHHANKMRSEYAKASIKPKPKGKKKKRGRNETSHQDDPHPAGAAGCSSVSDRRGDAELRAHQ